MEIEDAWPICVITPAAPLPLSFVTCGSGRSPTPSFSPRCSPPSPARSARNTASNFWSTYWRTNGAGVWMAFGLLGSLIAADNLLWRLASWIANFAFVGVTGDLRRDLVPPPHRPFAGLFRRPSARHADEPRHRDLERGLHRREYVRLERAAAVRGDRCGDRFGRSPSACRWPQVSPSSPASWS